MVILCGYLNAYALSSNILAGTNYEPLTGIKAEYFHFKSPIDGCVHPVFTLETAAGASSKTGTIEVGQTQQVELTLKSTEPIPSHGEIQIKLPSNFYYNSSAGALDNSMQIIYIKTQTNIPFKNTTLLANQTILSAVLLLGMRAGEFGVILENVQTPDFAQEVNSPVVANLHYTPGTSCPLGYIGDNCDIAVCFGINATSPDVCNGRGVCSAPDHCQCFNGLMGQECKIGLDDTITIVIAAASAGGATAIALGCMIITLAALLLIRRRKKVQQYPDEVHEVVDSSESSVDFRKAPLPRIIADANI